jgi:H+/Cl- antiporter ClcA
MMLVKALLTSTSFATGFEGGPIFPLIFMGGILGLALSEILTFIPQGGGVTAGMAGITCAVFPPPLTIALLLGLLGGQTDLFSVIVIWSRCRFHGVQGTYSPTSEKWLAFV